MCTKFTYVSSNNIIILEKRVVWLFFDFFEVKIKNCYNNDMHFAENDLWSFCNSISDLWSSSRTCSVDGRCPSCSSSLISPYWSSSTPWSPTRRRSPLLRPARSTRLPVSRLYQFPAPGRLRTGSRTPPLRYFIFTAASRDPFVSGTYRFISDRLPS